MPKTVVTFDAIPGVMFVAPIPKADGTAIRYTKMQVGSDDTIRVRLHRDGVEVELTVEVEHDGGALDEVIVGIALRRLLRAVIEATHQEFLEARRRMIASQQGEASL